MNANYGLGGYDPAKPFGNAIEAWDDATRTHHDYTTGQDVTRPYTAAENTEATARETARAQQAATLTDLTERIKRIEAAVWPAPPPPTVITDPSIRDWAGWGGVVPPGQLLKDTDGRVYRNVTTVPLTTPPTAMPSGPGAWTHLWAPLTITPPVTGTPAWSGAGVAYKVGDKVTYGGATYTCLQAHTSQAGWTPTAVPSLWSVTP